MSTLHRGGKGNLNAIQIFCLTISNLPSDEWQAKTAALKQLIRTIALIVNPNAADVDHDDDCSVMSEDSRSVYVLKNIESTLTSPRRAKSVTAYQHHQSNRVLLPPSLRSSQGLKRSGSKESLTSLASEATGCSMSVTGVPPTIPKSETMLQPQSLRQLHTPFRTLLTDLRTLVVKAACYNIAKLSKLVGDNARLLMTDILPDILALHGQTVKVMHAYAMHAMSTVIQHCKFRGGISILVKEGKGHKSKDVRCICMKYFHQILDCWPQQFLAPDIEVIGQTLVRSLVDSSQAVRMEGRKTFLHSYFRNYPELWYKLVHSPDGVLANDPRLKKSILANSVALASENKGSSSNVSKSLHVPKKRNENGINNKPSSMVQGANSKQIDSIPSSAFPSNPFQHVAHHTPMNRRLNGSARRRAIHDELRHKAACSIQAVVRGTSTRKKIKQIRLSHGNSTNINTDNNPFFSNKIAQDALSPVRIVSQRQIEISPLASPDVAPNRFGYRPALSMRSSSLRPTNIKPQPLRSTSYNNKRQSIDNTPLTRTLFPKSTSNNTSHQVESVPETSSKENVPSADDDQNDESIDSFLASPIKPVNGINGKKRRESSIIFQQRLDQQDHDQMLNISHSILSLHRKHMSELMDALREEMDLISIFESSILEDSKPQNRVKNGSNKNRLTEDQVLKYYENVLNCLDERSVMINNLRQKLEELSQS